MLHEGSRVWLVEGASDDRLGVVRTLLGDGREAMVAPVSPPVTLDRGDERRYPEHLPMVCDCGDANHAHADALLMEVTRRLSRGGPELLPHDVTAGNFVTELCRSLAWDIRPSVRIESIGCDQWFGIKASDLEDDEVYVQCDRVEHGLAAIWKHYADRQGLAVEGDE